MAGHTPDLNIHIVSARRALVDTRWHSVNYSDGHNRLYLPERGGGRLYHHDRAFDLQPAVCYLIPAHTIHSYECPVEMTIHYIHFYAAIYSIVPLLGILRLRYALELPHTDDYLVKFEEIERSMGLEGIGADLARNALLLQIFAGFIEGQRDDYGSGNDAVLRFKPVFVHIDDHLCEPVNVGRLAELMNMDRAYFSRMFKSTFGISPGRYMIRRKIETAAHMLRERSVTLDEVAEGLGFVDGFHLSRTFKNVTGMSPRDFRRRKIDAP